ncbi:copper resistance protein CopC [Arthrobacter sp. BB-1]|uniref:copper resistance CopC family protein n=1 Tax=unclassified Arthrobacter TaxID=235627 RepID=UPI0010EB41F4|nr:MULTISPECIES: copper resistance CopC family protein [unclassified Arthrobacter]TNB75631.1 copper resistance protein CopC [Arthrobacter sp. BB-1]VII98812.1 Copper resistance protein CopC [Arthrobacter sp. DR-2P]
MTYPAQPPRRFRRISLVLALAAAAMLPVVVATQAQAHDALQSTAPARDSTVPTAPETVSLTLSETPTGAGEMNFSVITVTDSTGKTLSDGKVSVDGATISTALAKGSNGPYKVLWRTVSSDGHPIEGSYTFTVQDATTAASATAAPSTAAPTAAASSAAAAPAQAVDPAPMPDNSNAPIVGLIAAVVVAIVGAAVVLPERARRRKADPQGQ